MLYKKRREQDIQCRDERNRRDLSDDRRLLKRAAKGAL